MPGQRQGRKGPAASSPISRAGAAAGERFWRETQERCTAALSGACAEWRGSSPGRRNWARTRLLPPGKMGKRAK